MLEQSRLFGLLIAALSAVASLCAAEDYYKHPPVFGSRPAVNAEKHFGDIGVTGLNVRIYKGVAITVEAVSENSPAAGKFTEGEVITAVNGRALKGLNPYVALGKALTKAEAGDGRLVFTVLNDDREGPRDVALRIPVLGAYSETWPLQCAKSRTIIRQAAEYYATNKEFARNYLNSDAEGSQIGAALACLFLLSTGEDQYLPVVKAYVERLGADIDAIGNHTWNNGYNGIACAEYYLRTGDKSALPVLQYYADNAAERQFFGVGWPHWGKDINPRYVAGGLMNPAGAQIVTTLLLAKECGVEVDDSVLLGSLKQWYRFVGHGTVPYGDHRAEGGLGSNGKDGMAAAIMQVASTAQDSADIYTKARNHLSMNTLTSYPRLVTGHGDGGRGDGIWRGIAAAYMLEVDPQAYHKGMKHLQWWYDLSRRSSGAFGMATANSNFDDPGSGAALALAYTAPLKTLRITGAPRSKHAKPFSLPRHLWGREADRAFLSIENNPAFEKYGKEEPIYKPFNALGNAYRKPGGEKLESLPRAEMLKNVFHKRYMIRAQAAKALRRTEAYSDLETLLKNQDPRVRRAALDGLIDYRYWFAMGKNPIAAENLSETMLESIKGMLADPDEALYVVDGALMALSRARPEDIVESLPLIQPWTNHEDWWLRQSSFAALNAAAQDREQLPRVLPTMIDMFVREYRTMARGGMKNALIRILKNQGTDSETGQRLLAGLKRGIRDSKVIPGRRAGEGTYNVLDAATSCVKTHPASAPDIAGLIQARFAELETQKLPKIVNVFMEARDKLPAAEQKALTKILYTGYREHLADALEAGEEGIPLDTILALTNLKNPDLGWEVVGTPPPAERIWRFSSFEPRPEDALHPRVGKRFRDVVLPERLEGWSRPDYDASQWTQGKAPIGTGVFSDKKGENAIENQSSWGEGEFLVMRTRFNVESLEHQYYRLKVLSNQGYHVYLNGHKVHTYIWWKNSPFYRSIGLDAEDVKHLKKGRNRLAVYANAAFKDGKPVAQIDVYIEGLKKRDLLGTKIDAD